MTRALVRLGDKTTSGGEVISASSTIIEGRNIALNGDMAWCPKDTCNGPFQINGTAYYFAENKPCVATGDQVLCNCKNNQVLGSTAIWVEDSPSDPFEEHRKRAAEWPMNKIAAAAIAAVPVFAKSVLRGTGNTDAGKSEEPQSNIGEMSFYQSQPTQPDPEPEQHAQAAKKKKNAPPPEPPKKSLFDKVTGFFFGEAGAMPLPPPPVITGTAEAGIATSAGGATAKASQDAATALTHSMKRLSGPEVWNGRLAMNLPFVVMGAIIQSNLKGEQSDLLTPQNLLEVAHSKGIFNRGDVFHIIFQEEFRADCANEWHMTSR
ncbi:PAAR domain-containing protein [Citrobacter freundii]|uniref:PAAR domain-containing protein n=1 Tax=Citrobacter freundii TaxID=546 RepID=A0ABD7AVM4_CITFR|nr:PAAR domain-containing protein [Citrobacter freundii]QLY35621.1 PAAR domain-containing protein [Citrobacter freundii]QMA45815.1 PAAR domain-containing protein [Citrobacter freundii]